MSSTLADIQQSVKAFASTPLRDASLGLLSALGYRSGKTIAFDGKPAQFKAQLDNDGKLAGNAALFEKWREVRFLFQLSNDEIPMLARAASIPERPEAYGKSIIDSFVFLAIDLDDTGWTRSALAGITRSVNSLFAMPVIILFKHEGYVSLAVSERRQSKRDATRDVQTGKISIILNITVARPHAGHVRILDGLRLANLKNRPSNFEELYEGWLAALSTKTLNERFYKELANWFFWARELVEFPEGAGTKKEVPLIRLLTRLIFCWFIREKDLIPDSLFRADELVKLLKHDPSKNADASDYYKAILQNLFFATLNTEMGEGRKWRSKNSSGQDGHHMIHSVYRYQDMFQNPDAALEIFRQVPFLNGGLFECLDRDVTPRELERDADLASRAPDGKRLRVDGFSDHAKNPLKVPNCIFFGGEIEVDLNKEYDTKGKAYKAKGLFTLFEDYVFTVEENTSTEEAVALDPELLGKVFENLLASYNEETSTTARKKSGAFYTPRYVVDYMVRETLAHQFVRALFAAQPTAPQGIKPKVQSFDLGPAPGELAMERGSTKPATKHAPDTFTPRVKALLDPATEPPTFTEAETETLVAAIEGLKILDPACGSGAFPMGMLQALMDVLRQLDPDNAKWRARNVQPYTDRLAAARILLDSTRREQEIEEAEKALQEVESEFADNDLANYVRKLHLIEKCLYGSDIQPIAILIAKLRFFISLAVEQKPHPARPNLGIKPLPNLETKLVAANSLIPLDRPAQDNLFADKRITVLERNLERATQSHFAARTMKTKRKYRDVIAELRDSLADILQSGHALDADDAKKAAAWNPFDQNASAPFFDPLWMFQLHDGFDIVIGNPPYVRQEKIKELKPALEKHYGQKNARKEPLGSYAGTADLFVYFIERGIRLLKPGGAFSYITSNKWYRAKYGENLRYWMSENTNLQTIIDFGDADVFDAIAYPTIIIAERRLGAPVAGHSFRALNWQNVGVSADKEQFPALVAQAGFDMPQVTLEKTGWQIEPTVKRDLLARIRNAGVPLGDYVEGRFYRGILTGYNEAFVIDGAKRAELIAADPKSAEIIKPFLRGRDVKRWRVEPQDLWLIFTRRGTDIDAYPAIKAHLELFRDGLEPKPTDWEASSTTPEWPGRKAGSYKWFEVQDNIAYFNEFETSKIVYPDIYEHQSYAWDSSGAYCANTAYFIPTEQRWMCGILNSPIIEWYYRQVSSAIRGGYLRAFSEVMQYVPIARTSHKDMALVDCLTGMLSVASNPALEQLLNGLVYELYFESDLNARGLHLFEAVTEAGLDSLSGLEGAQLGEAAATFAKQHLAPGTRLRTMLSDLQTLDVVRIIEGKA
jgi:adenine-specific DNA-methyltransferase